MKISAEQIVQNWEALMNVIENNFEGERKEKLKSMYADLEDRMCMQPASSVNHYHNAFEGGYVDHVLRVIKCADEVHALWTKMGADMSGYTYEELIFVALNHDIGKMGFPGEGDESNKPYFISRTADSKLKTNIGYVMHQADAMAARIEYEMWRNNQPAGGPVKKQYPKKGLSNPNVDAQAMFKDLFGDK